jgi:hypothetical protein
MYSVARANQTVGAQSMYRHGLVVGNRGQAVTEPVRSGRHSRHVRVRHGGARHVLRSGRLPVLEMMLHMLQMVCTCGLPLRMEHFWK